MGNYFSFPECSFIFIFVILVIWFLFYWKKCPKKKKKNIEMLWQCLNPTPATSTFFTTVVLNVWVIEKEVAVQDWFKTSTIRY